MYIALFPFSIMLRHLSKSLIPRYFTSVAMGLAHFCNSLKILQSFQFFFALSISNSTSLSIHSISELISLTLFPSFLIPEDNYKPFSPFQAQFLPLCALFFRHDPLSVCFSIFSHILFISASLPSSFPLPNCSFTF